MKGPSPIEIDALASNYLAQKQVVQIAQDNLGTLHDELLEICEQYGTPHAEKSRLLLGDEFKVVRSKKQSTSVDQPLVAKLYTVLKKRRCFHVFFLLFKVVVKYEVAPTAEKLLAAPELPKRAPRNLRALFAEAVHVADKSPSLSVEPLDARKKGA